MSVDGSRDWDAATYDRVSDPLKPGGQLVAQCGGRGNIDAFRTLADAIAGEEPFVPYFAEWQRPWNYAGDTETGAATCKPGSSPSRSGPPIPAPSSRPSAWSGIWTRSRMICAVRSWTACSRAQASRSCSSTCG